MLCSNPISYISILLDSFSFENSSSLDFVTHNKLGDLVSSFLSLSQALFLRFLNDSKLRSLDRHEDLLANTQTTFGSAGDLEPDLLFLFSNKVRVPPTKAVINRHIAVQ